MKNAVNREIPEELLKDGKEVYQGKYYMAASCAAVSERHASAAARTTE